VPVTLVMHRFWAYEGTAQMEQMFNFLKNLAIIGGLLELAAVGAEQWSLDALSPRRHWSAFGTGAQRSA